ncbi:MAG: type ISP restriction/modification enzyme, partial [bacterium]
VEVIPELAEAARATLGEAVEVRLGSVLEDAAAADGLGEGVPVVIGNPPWANTGRANQGRWVRGLMGAWRPGGERKWNPGDSVKFLRWAQWLVERRGAGMVALVTPSTWLDAVTLRRARRSLAETFDDLWLLDLHGNARKAERCPDGSADENVFGVQQGVAVALMVRGRGAGGPARVRHADVWGARERKLGWLAGHDVASTRWRKVKATGEKCRFAPSRASEALRAEYERGWRLTDIFRVWGNGLKTDRDRLFIAHDWDALAARMRRFFSDEGVSPEFRMAYRVRDSSSYDLLARRKRTAFDAACIRPCLYRPFDVRWVYYQRGLTSRPGWRVLRHLVAGPNVALIASRTVYGAAAWRDVFVTQTLSEFGIMAARPGNSAPVFPLWAYPREGGSPEPNLSAPFLAALRERVGGEATPEAAFGYLYAVLHAPAYRQRYQALLKMDYPRVPLPPDGERFAALAGIGGELVRLHLLEGKLSAAGLRFRGCGDRVVGTVRYEPEAGRVRPNAAGACFEGVSPGVWGFHVGGYPVCRKWLKGRRGRELSRRDVACFRRIVAAIEETLGLMAADDEALGAMHRP